MTEYHLLQTAIAAWGAAILIVFFRWQKLQLKVDRALQEILKAQTKTIRDLDQKVEEIRLRLNKES